MFLIHRYIFKEFIAPSIVGSIFFTFIFSIQKISELVSLSLEKGVSLDITLQLFLYMLPFTAAITIPMGVLFGVLMNLGNLSANSELIAMRTNGISLAKIYLSPVLFGIITTLFMFWFMNVVMPESNYRYKTLYRNVLYANPSIMVDERVFVDLPGRQQRKMAALDVVQNGKLLKSVFIYEIDEQDESSKIIFARTGSWSNNTINSPVVTLNLQSGKILTTREKSYNELQNLTFEEVAINIFNRVRKIKDHTKGPREQSILEVRERIVNLKKDKKKISNRLKIEYHKKFSIPIACLIFVIVGFPLGISFYRSGKGISFGFVIIIIFTYYTFMSIGEGLGRKDIIPASLSMYLPNIVLLIIGTVLMLFKIRE